MGKKAFVHRCIRRTRKTLGGSPYRNFLPRPADGNHYSLEELGNITDRLVKLHEHFPGLNPHWKPIKRRLRPSIDRLYRKWGFVHYGPLERKAEQDGEP